MTRFRRLLCLLLSCTAAPASATVTYCVATPTQLQAALDAAESNGEADFIKVRAGVYALSDSLHYSSQGAGADQLPVIISGGYNSTCSMRTGMTLLDAQNAQRVMMLDLGGADLVVIDHLTLMRGVAGMFVGGGANLTIVMYDQGGGADVHVEASRFLLGHGETSAGGLSVSGWGTFTLRNSLFNGNVSDGTVAFALNITGEAYVVNNTIANNTYVGSNTGFIVYSNAGTAASHVEFSNNIIWGNDGAGYDLYMLQGERHRLYHNDIGTHTSLPGANASGNLSVDPLFGNCGALCVDLPLAAGSPLTNMGDNGADPGVGSTDLLDAPRVGGGVVDIGAYELDRLFDDDFEAPGSLLDG